tara:strand:+ start:633 stop:2072 length:1440 start_codon:yes stop_codon:yes gene_type:complete
MPLILGTNSIKETGYDVANSCRFNDGSSDHLVWNSSPEGNRKKFTFSIWFKRAKLGSTQVLASASYSSGDEGYLYISSGDTIEWDSTNSGDGDMFSSIKLRDTSAWYHLVWAVDTTQSSAGNRMKFYLNGTQMTNWSTETQPNLNQNLYWNVGGTYYPYIGRRHSGDYWGGYMAEIVQIDDQQLDPTSFGEFDSDTPTVWKPKDLSDLTFGGNTSYYLDFQDSSSLGNDVSGNNHDFTAQNLTSIDQSTDTCTNNYATFNSLLHTNATLTEGNLQAQSPASGGNGGISTFGASKGKWYAEFKQVAESTSNEGAIGVIDTIYLHTSNVVLSSYIEYNAGTYGLRDGTSKAGFYTSSGSVTSTNNFHDNWTTNDIIGIALDIDNNRVYFSKNGQWTDGSGNWDESNPTGYLTIQSTHGEGTYMFAVGDSSSANNVTWAANFGSPPFSISSGNSDANGYGNFEYAVPSGYYALNTKNLAEFG